MTMPTNAEIVLKVRLRVLAEQFLQDMDLENNNIFAGMAKKNTKMLSLREMYVTK